MNPTLQIASEETDKTRLGTVTTAEPARGHARLITASYSWEFSKWRKREAKDVTGQGTCLAHEVVGSIPGITKNDHRKEIGPQLGHSG